MRWSGSLREVVDLPRGEQRHAQCAGRGVVREAGGRGDGSRGGGLGARRPAGSAARELGTAVTALSDAGLLDWSCVCGCVGSAGCPLARREGQHACRHVGPMRRARRLVLTQTTSRVAEPSGGGSEGVDMCGVMRRGGKGEGRGVAPSRSREMGEGLTEEVVRDGTLRGRHGVRGTCPRVGAGARGARCLVLPVDSSAAARLVTLPHPQP